MRALRPSSLAAAVLTPFLTSTAARAKEPFCFDEVARVERFGSFSLSPDGKRLAYAVMTADVGENPAMEDCPFRNRRGSTVGAL